MHLFSLILLLSVMNSFFQLCSVDALRKIVCSEVVQMNLKDRETHEVNSSSQVDLSISRPMLMLTQNLVSSHS